MRTTKVSLEGTRENRAASKVRRLSVHGVSVSPQGFWVILLVPGEGYWPIQVTSNPEDECSATSPEALTILQLISGVDMAGSILPPDILAQTAVLQCESKRDDAISREICGYVKASLPDNIPSYTDAHPWFRSRIKLPQVTLDELNLNPLTLQCTSRGIGSFPVVLTDEILQEVCYNYDADVSHNFVAVALALRYKAPLEVSCHVDTLDEDDLMTRFPLFKSANNLIESSQRVTKNIERGFEYNKLSGALRIALERGDVAAAERIREQLDKFDSFDDLPTLGESSSDLNSMQ